MEKTVLAIAGKPGLYTLVKQGRGMLIVESIDETRKRIPAAARDRVTSLNDVSMYTTGEDVPLMSVFDAIKTKYNAAPVDIDVKKATAEELSAVMGEVLPDYDRDRVHVSDMKKALSWFNILVGAGFTEFKVADDNTAGQEPGEAKAE